MSPTQVYLIVTLSAFFWGANFVLIVPVLADLDPLWGAALRFVVGAALMLGLVAYRREALLAPIPRHAGAYAVLGSVGIAGFNLLFFWAMQSTSPTNAALIMATNPLMTALMAALLVGERPTTAQLLAIPVAFAGVVVVISGGDLRLLAHLNIVQGDGLMLLANLFWAAYNALGKRLMPPGSQVVNTTWVMLVGAGLLLAVAVGSGAPLAMPGLQAALALAGMAVGGTVLAYLFWNTGIAHLGAGRTALFLNLVPVFAMTIEAGLGHLPSGSQLLGGAVVIAGVGIAMMPGRKARVA
ncbi:MAG: EamA/RhaT family transporter [Alphaproteobacteria bacterium CG_4_10_14_0_2_um_filter_63_37]|nr:MAG: multidrug DMT transporter permease [Proteobacteria bacterium CG1_02_64_396]PJA23423.1 MAG: EamA/RhaT family transporter [Alphaproteobacteria bacterium CG_4_10_14_0_2_um_filter_63_37]